MCEIIWIVIIFLNLKTTVAVPVGSGEQAPTEARIGEQVQFNFTITMKEYLYSKFAVYLYAPNNLTTLFSWSNVFITSTGKGFMQYWNVRPTFTPGIQSTLTFQGRSILSNGTAVADFGKIINSGISFCFIGYLLN